MNREKRSEVRGQMSAERVSSAKGAKRAKLKVLPCPFCGNQPHFGLTSCAVFCGSCPVGPSVSGKTLTLAAQVWNKRATSNDWKRVCEILGKGHDGQDPECTLTVLKMIVESYGRMCNRAQAIVQKHRLGLAGQHVDEICFSELERRLEMEAELRDAHGPGMLRGSMRVRPYGGTYVAKVRIGTTTYHASCTSCEDQAAKNLAEKVQKERCAERVTLSVGTPGADTGPEFKGETHYVLTVWEGGAA